MSTATILLLIVAILAIAFAAFVYFREERTKRLRTRYGSEYERAVDEYGSRMKAEQHLAARERRVERFHIHPLSRDHVTRFGEEWRIEQARFVDDPRGAVAAADNLVRNVMEKMGYPVLNFDQRAEDLSVDHPKEVSNYRTAHEIALRDASGQASTEDLRKAMVHYRALFEDLLGERVHTLEEVKR